MFVCLFIKIALSEVTEMELTNTSKVSQRIKMGETLVLKVKQENIGIYFFSHQNCNIRIFRNNRPYATISEQGNTYGFYFGKDTGHVQIESYGDSTIKYFVYKVPDDCTRVYFSSQLPENLLISTKQNAEFKIYKSHATCFYHINTKSYVVKGGPIDNDFSMKVTLNDKIIKNEIDRNTKNYVFIKFPPAKTQTMWNISMKSRYQSSSDLAHPTQYKFKRYMESILMYGNHKYNDAIEDSIYYNDKEKVEDESPPKKHNNDDIIKKRYEKQMPIPMKRPNDKNHPYQNYEPRFPYNVWGMVTVISGSIVVFMLVGAIIAICIMNCMSRNQNRNFNDGDKLLNDDLVNPFGNYNPTQFYPSYLTPSVRV